MVGKESEKGSEMKAFEEVDINRIKPNEFNPQRMSDDKFNLLCNNIQRVGMNDPIQVVRLKDYDLIVDGEHRWRACKALGIKTVPVIIVELENEDEVKFQNMRANILRGNIDPEKFAKLYDDLAKTYGEQLTQEMMGFADEAEFEKLYQSVKRALPPELQKGLEEAKKEIKTIAGLSQILNSLFARYGATLKYSFMTFEYGGRKHTVVMMDRKLKDQIELLKKYCIEYKKGICPFLTQAIKGLFKEGLE